MGKLKDLERLQKLKENGILTEEEFLKEKQQILKTESQINESVKCCEYKENISNKDVIKIKLNHIILAIILIIVTIIFVMILNIKDDKTLTTSNRVVSSNNKVQGNNSLYNTVNPSVQNNKLSVIDEKNKELKINAHKLMDAIIKANREKTEEDRDILMEYTKILNNSMGNYNLYTVGINGIHGKLADYPYLIIENKVTGNVARICLYYAYSQETGTDLNTSAIDNNYELLNRALNSLNQKELINTITTIRNKIYNGDNDDMQVKGIEYGVMDGSRNNFGNLKGMYVMFGATMDALVNDTNASEGNKDETNTNQIVPETNKEEENTNKPILEDKEEESNTVEPTLLEQIETIDPKNEYPVYYNDYKEYWILDKEDKKIYFNDVESFKNAIEIYKERENKEKIENVIEEDNKEENEYYDTSVSFSREEIENKTAEELVKLFKENGLVPKVVNKTEEVPYPDKLANTTVVTYIQSEFGDYYYQKGDTVKIETTYYKPVAWTTYVSASVNGKVFNIGGKDCYIDKQNVGRYSAGAYCFFEDPLKLDSYWLYGEDRGKGVEFYIDNKLIYSGSFLWEEYTFDKVETITFKIVAPYIYEFDEKILDGEKGTMLGTNVTVYEKKINIKDIYKSKNEEAHIDIE